MARLLPRSKGTPKRTPFWEGGGILRQKTERPNYWFYFERTPAIRNSPSSQQAKGHASRKRTLGAQSFAFLLLLRPLLIPTVKDRDNVLQTQDRTRNPTSEREYGRAHNTPVRERAVGYKAPLLHRNDQRGPWIPLSTALIVTALIQNVTFNFDRKIRSGNQVLDVESTKGD